MESVRSYIDQHLLTLDPYPQRLLDLGYHRVNVGSNRHFHLDHEWLMVHIGWENYNWCGTDIWFNRHEDAIWFSLARPQR